MIQHSLSRTELLIGKEALEKLNKSKVVVLGVGGVGSFIVEALARSGVGNLVLVDDDDICITNINRQIHANFNTIGMCKVEVIKERVLSINPNCNVQIHKTFIKEENISELIPLDTDYVADAIDTITSKIALIVWCKKHNINIISSMGTGNKFDPTEFKVADIYDTKICPLSKVMRHELRKRGVEELKVVYSEEVPVKPNSLEEDLECGENCVDVSKTQNSVRKKQTPGSMSFVPPVAGMIIGGEIIKDIISK